MASVTIEEMRPKMLTLDTVMEQLHALEPVESVVAAPAAFELALEANWNAGVETTDDLINGSLTVDGTEMLISKGVFSDLIKPVGLSQAFVKEMPAQNIQDDVNAWHRLVARQGASRRVLTKDGNVLAIAPGTREMFSTVEILDRVIDGIHTRYGDTEILVDYKKAIGVHDTTLRLVLPDQVHVVPSQLSRSGHADEWSMGITVSNSLTGMSATAVRGSALRWWCTNGATYAAAESGGEVDRRRKGVTPESVYDWVAGQVDGVLGYADTFFHALDALAGVEVGPEEIGRVLADLFRRGAIPARLQSQIREALLASTDHSMYGVMQAITSVANSPDRTEREVMQLLDLGGSIPDEIHARCGTCHRSM